MAKRKLKSKAKARPRHKKKATKKLSKSSIKIADLRAQNRNLHAALVATQEELADLRSN